MKNLAFIVFFLSCLAIYSQVPPQLINYQGVARNLNGQPITGPISIKLDLHKASANGLVVFTETHNVVTNTFGIFNLQIGQNNPSQFSSIVWANGPFYLEVSMDPANGSNYSSISNQQLVSVPYALYAENAKNANTTSITASSNVTVTSAGTNTFNLAVPNYVAGNNVTITPSGSNYVINAANSSSVGSYSLSINSPHAVTNTPVSSIINIVPPSISITGGGGSVTANALPNYVLNIPTVAITPTPGGIIVNQGPATYSVPVSGSGPWSSSLTNVFLTTGLTNVGIGTTAPIAKLDVVTTASNAINATSTGGGNAINAITTGTGLGIYSSSSTGAALIGVNSSAIGAAVQANNSGTAESFYAYKTNGQTGTVAKFENLSAVNTLTTVVINSNAGNIGLSSSVGAANAIVANSNGGTPSIYAANAGAGSAIEAQNLAGGPSLQAYKTSASGSAAMFNNSSATNSSPVLNVNNSNTTGGIAVNVTHTAGVGVSVVTSGSGNVINATTSGGGIGVNVISGGNNAVNATNNSSTTAAILGNNIGQGTGIQGTTASGLTFAYGVQGTNTGGGSGVYGETAGSSGFAAGVYGYSTGDLPAMLARNVWGSSGVNASGIRAITNSSNVGSAGVHGENLGTGPAVKASLTTFTVAGSLNAALLVENGHIKALGATPTMSTYAFNGFTGGVVGLGGTFTSANDVKGTVSFYTPSGFAGVVANAFIEQTIAFAKPYSISPTVVLTPQVDMLDFEYLVKNISPLGFTIRVYRSSNSLLPTSATQNYEFKFSYIVIE